MHNKGVVGGLQNELEFDIFGLLVHNVVFIVIVSTRTQVMNVYKDGNIYDYLFIYYQSILNNQMTIDNGFEF